MWPDRTKTQISGIAVALCAFAAGAGWILSFTLDNRAPLIIGGVIGLYLLFSLKVADQWEKVAVLRMGRYIGLRGPGLFHVIPVIDRLSRYVDQRVRVASVMAESTLTRDTVPVNVDAIVFWMVWNAEKTILEVEDYVQAITMSAQTGLRESIGRHELSQMITERESLGRELQRILDKKQTHGASRFSRWKFATFASRRGWKTRCPARRRPNASARPASFWGKQKRRFRRSFQKPHWSIRTILSHFICAL